MNSGNSHYISNQYFQSTTIVLYRLSIGNNNQLAFKIL